MDATATTSDAPGEQEIKVLPAQSSSRTVMAGAKSGLFISIISAVARASVVTSNHTIPTPAQGPAEQIPMLQAVAQSVPPLVTGASW